MSEYPREIPSADIPSEIRKLVSDLMPRLLTGPAPALATLRAQYSKASIAALTLTGHGFYAHFTVSAESPLIDNLQLLGGMVPISIDELEHGAGCVLGITGGRLDFLGGYTYGEQWPERPTVLSFGPALPLEIPASAT